MDYNYIAIEGTIGAGKTSLARMLSAEYNARLILEQFEDNAFLPNSNHSLSPIILSINR